MAGIKKPSWDSTTAKTLRTVIYEVVALLLALLAMPEVIDLIAKYYPEFIAVTTIAPVVLTFIVNYLNKNVDNY
jgi:hypothetical protein